MPDISSMTVEEVIEYGRTLQSDPTWNGYSIHGRAVTNAEMYAMNQFTRDGRWKAERFLKEEL